MRPLAVVNRGPLSMCHDSWPALFAPLGLARFKSGSGGCCVWVLHTCLVLALACAHVMFIQSAMHSSASQVGGDAVADELLRDAPTAGPGSKSAIEWLAGKTERWVGVRTACSICCSLGEPACLRACSSCGVLALVVCV